MHTISDFKGKSQNLGFVKMVAAVLVIVSHTWPVLGRGIDPLWFLSHEQMTFGGLAVAIFFFSSGFFVTRSMLSKNGKRFFRSRLIRLYPAFAAVILLSTFVLGPLVTQLPAGSYFSAMETWSYLLYLVMIPHYQLPGVFSANPISLVNGSLWTMILEVFCYISLFFAWKIKLLQKRFLRWQIIAYILCALVIFGLQPDCFAVLRDYLRPVFLFISGIFFCFLQDRIPLGWSIGACSSLLFLGLFILGYGNLALVLLFPLILSQLVFSPHQVSPALGHLGDWSYALYLVAFPIQQLCVMLYPQSGIALHVALSVLCSFPVALCLYYGVEKRFSSHR